MIADNRYNRKDNLMRNDIYTYIHQCLQGIVNLDGTYPTVIEKKCGSYLNPRFQKPPKKQLYELCIRTDRSRICAHNRSVLRRRLEAMYAHDIIQSYTLTERMYKITWAEQYNG